MTKDEMKNRISMSLKDPGLQQGFEIICKNLAELEQEKCELLGIIQGKDEAIKELNLANEKYVDKLTEAKEIINELLRIFNPYNDYEGAFILKNKAEQFIKE